MHFYGVSIPVHRVHLRLSIYTTYKNTGISILQWLSVFVMGKEVYRGLAVD